jgi:hypothetical protein
VAPLEMWAAVLLAGLAVLAGLLAALAALLAGLRSGRALDRCGELSKCWPWYRLRVASWSA